MARGGGSDLCDLKAIQIQNPRHPLLGEQVRGREEEEEERKINTKNKFAPLAARTSLGPKFQK